MAKVVAYPSAVRFGGVNLSTYLAGIEISRSLLAEAEEQTLESEGMDGSVYLSKRFKAQTITVVGVLRGHTVAEVTAARRSLGKLLYSRGLKALVLPDDNTLTYYATLVGSTDLSSITSYPRVTLRFLVPGVAGYGATKTVTLVANTAKTIDVDGDFPTWPTVQVASPSNPCRITRALTSNSPYVEVSGASSGLTIDMEELSVSSGTPSLGSTFFKLEPGNNTLLCNNAATVTYQERWV